MTIFKWSDVFRAQMYVPNPSLVVPDVVTTVPVRGLPLLIHAPPRLQAVGVTVSTFDARTAELTQLATYVLAGEGVEKLNDSTP